MDTSSPQVRVMTLNVWHSDLERAARMDALVEEVLQRGPDVLCLQEVYPATEEALDAATQVAERTGMRVAVAGGFVTRPEMSGLAILTRLEVTDSQVVELPGVGSNGNSHHMLVSDLVSPSGRPLVVATTHLAWGGGASPAREEQVVFIDALLGAHAASLGPDTFTVLTGDFNTEPDSDTLRFLLGKSSLQGRGTFWVDAWVASAEVAEATSGPDNPWAYVTAKKVGITDPSMLPPRRIDFVLVHGWAHGRPGSPMGARRCFMGASGPGDVVASDHWGVEADLFDPMVPVDLPVQSRSEPGVSVPVTSSVSTSVSV